MSDLYTGLENNTESSALGVDSRTLGRVFGKMALAVIVSALAAGFMLSQGVNLATGPSIIGFIIVIVLNILMGSRIQTMNPIAMYGMLAFESVYMGALTGGALQHYDPGMILVAFIVSALYFAALAFVGLTTRKDLTRVGTVASVALIVLIVVEIILFFINAPVLWMIASAVSLIIFAGLTAHDAQKVKYVQYDGSTSTENLTTMLALSLYLDFVNIFLNLLQIMSGVKK